MAKKILVDLDLAQNSLNNARVQNLAAAPSTPVKGQIYFNTTSNTFQYYDGTQWQTIGTGSGAGNVTKASNATASNIIQLSGGADKSIADYAPGTAGILKVSSAGVPSLAVSSTDYAPATGTTSALKGNGSGGFAAATLNDVGSATSAYSLGSQRITNLADPTGVQDAATKNYVDLATQGISWKQPVRAATTTNGTLASAYVNGSVIDGVTLATGDRILLKNQTTGTENGIYVVAASGAPSRASDADTGAKLAQAAVFVREGSTQADAAYVLTNDGTITVGTTSLTFVQFSTAGGVQSATTTTAGITRYATTAEAQAKSVSTAALTPASVADFARKFTGTIGDGSSTSIGVTHGLGSQYVTAQVYDATSNLQVECDVTLTSSTVCTFTFATAPTTNQYRVVIVG